jgi:RHS repeat-associated protein
LLTQRFDPFGGLVQRSTFNVQPAYGFAGEEQDPDSGQLFLRARTYNPSTGRFLQSDPVMGRPNDPRTLHHYSYAFNNPVNYTDPSGLMPATLSRSGGARLAAAPATGYAVYPGTQTGNYISWSVSWSGHAGGYRTGSFNATYMGEPGSHFNFANRSANGGAGQNWQRFSDPNARQQSQGFQPKMCGFTDILFGLGNSALNGNLLKDAFDFAMQIPTLARPFMPLLKAINPAMVSLQFGSGGLITDPTSFHADDKWVIEWFKGQLEDIKLAWNQGDRKMAASLGVGFVSSAVVMGLASTRIGPPLAILAGAASVVLNTTFNAWLYDDWGNFGANLAGSSVEMAFSLAGGLIGGPQGWIVGNVLGAGLGQITTNVLTGQQWDGSLLAAMLFSGLSEGMGGAIGHGLGRGLRNALDVNTPLGSELRGGLNNIGPFGRHLDEAVKGLNSLNRHEIKIVGFQGTGFSPPKNPGDLRGWRPEYATGDGTIDTLAKAGHIGVSFDGGRTIYGFHPTKAAIEEFDATAKYLFDIKAQRLAEELGISEDAARELMIRREDTPALIHLGEHGALRGQVYDDTMVFTNADRLASEYRAPTTVYELSRTVSLKEYLRMWVSVRFQVMFPLRELRWYRFPTPDGLPMPPKCNNCATWPRTIGLELPENSGQLKVYVPALKEKGGDMRWKPWRRR